MLPATIQLVHACEHEHSICTSKSDQHFHEADVDCNLCHLQSEVLAILHDNNIHVKNNTTQSILCENYVFILSNQPLDFSLRGPPTV